MGSEIPQPADDEFEARLSWTPSGADAARPPAPIRPRRAETRRPGRLSASGRRPAADPSGKDEGIDADSRLAELHAEVRAVREELEVVRSLFEELLGEDPMTALADPNRTAAELGSTMRVRLRRRSASR